jgi:hypothetical protein
MNKISIRFVISELSGEEMEDLNNNNRIVTKMILNRADFELFKYAAGDSIEVEHQDGYRAWCSINDLEVIHDRERVIIIFTLEKEPELIRKTAQR